MDKETTVVISDGLYINGNYVDHEEFIDVTRNGTLLKVNVTILVDQSNFTIDKGATNSNTFITFKVE